MQFNLNLRTDERTLLEPSLEDRTDEVESKEPKVAGVYNMTNKQPQPKNVSAYYGY